MRILYLMHVDWGWIKQRPHYLAEELSRKNYVYVLYNKFYNKKKIVANSNDIKNGPEPRPFYRIRGEFKSKIVFWLNQTMRRIKISRICKKNNIDTIYIPYPTMLPSVPKNFKGKILYDCMDDHVAMASHRAKPIVEKYEKDLISRADYILFSSKHLQKCVLERCEASKKASFIVRNGYSGFGETKEQAKTYLTAGTFNLCYFGTVSTWFDWDTIMYALDRCESLCLHVIGPNSTTISMPEHPRITYYGPIEHSRLAAVTENMDAFTMPFILNEIILSVDPVKLYEYVHLHKNILVPFYEEIERFEPFVYFYRSKDEFVAEIQAMQKSKQLKYTNDDRFKFLADNTWSVRAENINYILSGSIGE